MNNASALVPLDYAVVPASRYATFIDFNLIARLYVVHIIIMFIISAQILSFPDPVTRARLRTTVAAAVLTTYRTTSTVCPLVDTTIKNMTRQNTSSGNVPIMFRVPRRR